MKYKRWSIEEEDYIKENYNILPIKQIANKLGVTIKQIYAKAEYMGITREYITQEKKKKILEVKQSDIDELMEWAKDKKGIDMKELLRPYIEGWEDEIEVLKIIK